MQRPGSHPRSGFILPVILWCVVMLALLGLLWVVLAPRADPAAEVGKTRTDVAALVERTAAGQPGPGEGFDPPGAAVPAGLAAVARQIQDGDIPGAAEAAADYGYLVEEQTDIPTGSQVIALRPASLEGPAWGLYLFAPAASSGAVIEVPHPGSDLWTEDLGAELFLRTGARWLLMAGADRDAGEGADVAHDEGSVFEAVHVAVSADAGPVVQVHGFDGGSRVYGDAVVSSGTMVPDPLTERAAEALRGAGLTVCVYDATHCEGLGATTNLQGISAHDAATDFLHVELAQPIREDPQMRAAVVDALIAGLPSPT